MCTGEESNQGPLGPKSDALSTAPLYAVFGTSFNFIEKIIGSFKDIACLHKCFRWKVTQNKEKGTSDVNVNRKRKAFCLLSILI